MHRCSFTFTRFLFLTYFHQTATRFYVNCASQELLWQMWSEAHTAVISGLYNLHTQKLALARARHFVPQNIHSSSGAHQGPLFSEYQGSFLGPKQPACEVSHSTLSKTKVKNEYSYTSTAHTHLHNMDRDNFTFTFTFTKQTSQAVINPE